MDIERLIEFALDHGWKFTAGMFVLVAGFLVLSMSEGKRNKPKDGPPNEAG